MNTDRMRAWVEIDLAALLRNAAALRMRAGVPLLPMVKADAYGLGSPRIVEALEEAGPWGFGVATVEEGVELREAGVTRPIVVFTPALAAEFNDLREHELTPALGDRESIAGWTEGRLGPWHLAVETGMNRAGMRWTRVAELASAGLHGMDGAFTHFHSPELEDGTLEEQEARFEIAIAALPRRPRMLHAENSAAITRRTQSRWDIVRPGIFLYGGASGPGAMLQPENVVSLRARVVELHQVQAGESVSYDATFSADVNRTIATVAAGYADGYRRAFSNKGRGLLRGHSVPVAGLVTMDMTMLDVTDVDCAIGDVVTLLGRDGSGGAITLEGAAAASGISPYELLTGMRSRLPRVFRQV